MAVTLRTQCCIAGGGPAGAMLGLLLARRGVDVVVLEKHADFLRDFRGDTIHPSTMEILDELGLAEAFLALEPNRVQRMMAVTPGGSVLVGDLTRLRTRFPFIAMIPQWDFLDFITQEAARFPSFHLLMRTEATDLLEEGGIVHGVRYSSPDGEGEVWATLTVAADGRSSRLRARAGLPLRQTSPPIDVLWFRLPLERTDPADTAGYIGGGQFMALINRGDYWQIAYVIPKGSAEQLREAGIEELRRSIREGAPHLADRVDLLTGWDKVSLLSVQANRLRRWHRPGLLCIGDAAHAMSPVGGVGINFAIQDAVAAANVLAEPLRRGRVTSGQLARVQRQRGWQVRAMQTMQALAMRATTSAAGTRRPSPAVRLALRVAGHLFTLDTAVVLRTRLIALGLRRIHVADAAATRPLRVAPGAASAPPAGGASPGRT